MEVWLAFGTGIVVGMFIGLEIVAGLVLMQHLRKTRKSL